MKNQALSPDELAANIRERTPNIRPRIGIVLGSGLGEFADRLDNATRISYADLPGFPPVTVAGALGFIVAGWGVESGDSGLGFIHTEALISIVVMSVLFAPLGAKVAHSVDGKKLKKFFAIFLVFLGLTVITF